MSSTVSDSTVYNQALRLLCFFVGMCIISSVLLENCHVEKSMLIHLSASNLVSVIYSHCWGAWIKV